MIPWIFMLAAFAGTLLLRSGRVLRCWQVWTITNAYFILHNLVIREFAQATLYACHLFVSVSGWIKEQRKKTEAEYEF